MREYSCAAANMQIAAMIFFAPVMPLSLHEVSYSTQHASVRQATEKVAKRRYAKDAFRAALG